MKYAIVREDGVVEIRQDAAVELPQDALELSDEQHAQLSSGEFVLVGGQIIPAPTAPAPSLPAQKLAIDRAAESVRLRYLDGQPAKLAEYQRAYAAAVGWLADQQQPVPASVQSWADAKGWPPLQAATDIKTAGDWLNAKLDKIRELRLLGKAALDAGTKTEAEVLAELAAL